MMRNYSKLIASALQHGASASGYNIQAAREYLSMYAPDRRYKLYGVCGVACWAHNEHGKVRYAGREYEYQQSKTGYEVKPATW